MSHIVLTPLMHAIIPITVAANIILTAELLFNEYSSRYAALTVCCIYSVIADPILQQIQFRAHSAYQSSLTISQFIVVALMVFIIAEAWWIGDNRVRRLVEIQLAGQFIEFLLTCRGFLWTSYYLDCSLLLYSLLTLIYFCWIFKEPPHEPPSRA